jgi:uncharacterized protein involved in exopolysaccharide biosynthesis
MQPRHSYEAGNVAEHPPHEVAALHARLARSEQEIEDLEREVNRLRSRQAEREQALGDAGRPTPARAAARGTDDSEGARLRAALAEEQARRQAAETRLARLQEETTSPPIPGAPPDVAALQREVLALRQQLADERAAREDLARQLAATEPQPPEPRPQTTAAEEVMADELRARVRALEDERAAIVEGFDRNLAASNQRIAELDARLATADRAAANAASLQQENAELRARLDAEHQHTEELAAKLHLAERITDLIFKIRAQQSVRPALPVAPLP